MKRHTLQVEKREITGKKVKKLRKDGILPANIYGKAISSQAVQVAIKDFEPLYKEVGETGLIDVQLDGEKRPILIKNVFIDPLSRIYLHADFYQVNLKEKIKAMVPLITVGEPKAVSEKVGLLLQTLSEVEVEALPEDLPEKLEINVESLAAVDDQATVADLKALKGVVILTDASQVIAKISQLVSKEAEEQAKAEAAASEAAKAEAGAETPSETPAQGAATQQPASATETKPQEAPKE